MTILITETLGAFTQREDDLTAQLRAESKNEPLTTLYKIRTGTSYRLFMKSGGNNFICMQEKTVYRFKHIGPKSGLRLVAAKDDSIIVPVHDFVVQIAILKLK